MFSFGTDQSDILCCVDMTAGQHSFHEHSQVGAPVLQVRRQIGEQLREAAQHPGCGGPSWVSGRGLDLGVVTRD